jgi:carboxyl-terminal processing protease
MQDMRHKKHNFTFYFLLFSSLLCVLACVFAAQSAAVDSQRATIKGKAPSNEEQGQADVVETVCELIYRGQFEAADELVGEGSRLGQLSKIVQEYKNINQRRQLARKASYEEQLSELEKFRTEADNNDVNDIPAVFSVIVKASEFADDAQKEQLLSDSFVKKVFQQAIDSALEFESEGKWLEAYTNCHYWLQAIEPDNKAYSDYAEQLLDKASIVASFQDSPCESSEERYEGVKKEMFVRAISALKSNYVSVIDYRHLATKTIKRCELLGEVMKFPNDDFPLKIEDRKSLSAWSVALAGLLDEVEHSPKGVSRDKFMEVFDQVLALNKTTVQFPEPVLIAQFAEAALSALDPYTVMVWPRQVREFEKMMTNEFTGIGIEISKRKGLLTVTSLLPDTPAYNSDLDAGDVIAAADGVETKDMSLTCAVRKITGPAGTQVTLTINRADEEEMRDITITRAKIIVPTIRGWQRTEEGRWLYMIDEQNKIGYVRLTGFSAETASTLEEVLTGLEGEGLKGLVLDLRYNSGGFLDSAIAVADKFLEEGLLVITRPRSWLSSTYASAHKKKTHPDYPLVILINSGSASASEIVAGALQDTKHKRAVLVGERTHGKGSVQGITQYPGGDARLKYTMAYYHLPSDQRVESRETMKKKGREDWGVGPDIEIKLRTFWLRPTTTKAAQR